MTPDTMEVLGALLICGGVLLGVAAVALPFVVLSRRQP